MQDEDGKTEEKALAEEPVVEPVPVEVSESPIIIPEPTPELIAEPQPVVEPVSVAETPTNAPEPEIALEPDLTPPIAMETPPVVVTPPEAPKPEPTPVEAPKPPEPVPAELPKNAPEPPKETNGIPQKVLDLTPDELDAARRLWASRNIASVQAKSAHDRTARKQALLNEIVKYVKSNSPATISMIAYNMNISPRKVSDYLRYLVPSGRLKATGNTSSRKYS